MRCSFPQLPRISILSNGTNIIIKTSTSVTNQDAVEIYLAVFLTLIAGNFCNECSIHLFFLFILSLMSLRFLDRLCKVTSILTLHPVVMLDMSVLFPCLMQKNTK